MVSHRACCVKAANKSSRKWQYKVLGLEVFLFNWLFLYSCSVYNGKFRQQKQQKLVISLWYQYKEKTFSVQSRGRSLHWGLSWGIAHTRLFLCSPEVAHCTGGWAEVLHTHNSFCAVQRSFVVLGPAAIHRRNHAASFSLVLSIALTLHTFLSCTPKKTKHG